MTDNAIISAATKRINDILFEVSKAIVGKKVIIEKVLTAIIANGHILIEDMPGVGKTTLALAFSKALSLNYKRMQFTPDVLPADITGFSVYNQQNGNFNFKAGPAICNLFLADEINRTSSKTQAALLEIMEERKISIDGKSMEMPKPYIVIATQNPVGSIGTQSLPESQLDRFAIKLSMGYPDINDEINILKSKTNSSLSDINAVSSANDITALQKIAENIYVDDSIYAYIVHLADATRNHPMIKLGLSPRGTICLAAMAKSSALIHGRNYVIPDDVFRIFTDVSSHRIILQRKALLSDLSNENILNEIIKSVPVPKITV